MAKDYAKFVPEKKRTSKRSHRRVELMLSAFFIVAVTVAIATFIYIKKSPDALVAVSGGKTSNPFAKLMAALHHSKVDAPVSVKASVVANNQEPVSVHFNFYSELPSMQVTLPAVAASAAPPPLKKTMLAAANAPVIPVAKNDMQKLKESSEQVVATTPTAIIPAATNSEMQDSKAVAATLSNSAPATIFSTDEVKDLLEAENQPKRIDAQGEKYFIQVGVFSTLNAANRMQEALSMAGFHTQVIKSDNSFRVEQGPFTTKSLAKSSQQQLQKRGIDSLIRKSA